ncbi:glycosyltransferase family 4 protein [Sphingomonas faeni]|uniref:glycosyltransferase family 4 protein n=1 Tax=Sphingomonas faeni TaxID=185950 RepID=UPI0020BDE356|nr:glycosyltransferase family 1 protein [Sphingomonas faeni]
MTTRAVLDRAVHKKVKIAVDARLAGTAATGVASYRRAVLAALAIAGRTTMALHDGSVGRFGVPSTRREAASRWLSAWSSRPRRLLLKSYAGDGGDGAHAQNCSAPKGEVSRRDAPTSHVPARGAPAMDLLACDPPALWRQDVFRLAHIHFRRHGTLLRLTPPQPVGVMHWTYPIPAIVDGWINVHTVHDVIPLRRPDLSPIDADRLQACLLAIAARTDRIVTVSAWARRTILDALVVPADLVTDCGSGLAELVGTRGVGTAYLPGTGESGRADSHPEERGDGILPYDLRPDGYLFFCGVIEPRKNLARLAGAWRVSGCGMPLVVAGPDGAHGGALRRELERAGALVLPYQDRPVLIDLIRNARALVLLSLEEGFGLPVAEAMALGTPVLTSDRGALQEIAGGAGLLVDPTDAPAIAEALRRIVADDVLRGALVRRGLHRAEAFRPAAFGRRLTMLYDRLIDARIADGVWPELETAGER